MRPPPRSRSRRGSWSGFLRLYAVIAVLSWAFLLYADPTTSATTSASDEPSTTLETPYLVSVADALAADHAYVDPLLTSTAPPDLLSGALHDDLTADEPQAYAALVVTGPDDGSQGDRTLIAVRLHHLVGRDGVYLVADQDGYCAAVRFTRGAPSTGYCSTLSSRDLLDLRSRDDEDVTGTELAATRVLYPLVVGSGACVLIAWAVSVIGWLRRRDVPFLRVR